MKATLTSKGRITIPIAIRRRLGLQAGQVLEFDEEAPYILAVPVFDEEAMRGVIGCTRGRLGKTSSEWLDEARGQLASEAIQDRVLRLKRERLAEEMAAGYRLEAEQSSLDEEWTAVEIEGL